MVRTARSDRRRFLLRAAAAAGTLLLGGCDKLSETPWWHRHVLRRGEDATRTVQRAILSHEALAKEYAESDLSPYFRPNGSTDPADPAWRAHAANGFADWRLEIGGLVERPLSLSLAELRALPSRTQITRHDCVEGWSCIGKWKGVPLATVLRRAGLKKQARYIVFYCADALEPLRAPGAKYYESIGLDDAFHPQTILAYDMNDRPLPVPYGAPIRLRVERQLGYKMAKYVMRIRAVESFDSIDGGNGGYWEDRGYEWYAGI